MSSLYEEYMRNVLGYQPVDYDMMNNTYNTNVEYNNINTEISEYYPDIYKIVYPMIKNACNKNTKPITKELIDNITEEIYYAVESDEGGQNRKEDRQRNPIMNDLIRILLIRELFRRPGFPRTKASKTISTTTRSKASNKTKTRNE